MEAMEEEAGVRGMREVGGWAVEVCLRENGGEVRSRAEVRHRVGMVEAEADVDRDRTEAPKERAYCLAQRYQSIGALDILGFIRHSNHSLRPSRKF